ncbi:FxsA family protein [Actibacterium sp. MT2.3-13A]|uniref:FxsA family protein n=1 Tax=Actibacterium sp. MT2.3-13A TaxID=2828332 RepID=UPI001BA4EEAF|nr:FxsA family protein [Actibacterium sp. MT2.3-13A]
MWLFVLFLAVPLIEIALFVQVGGLIGLWPTLLIVVLTALLGTALMRNQGAQAMAQIRDSFNTLRDPAEPLAHGAMILFAGALLLTPGFFTDTVGFALLLPPVRRAVFRWAGKRVTVQSFSTGARPQPGPHPGEVIDGEFTEVPPEKRPTHRPSGWTRH